MNVERSTITVSSRLFCLVAFLAIALPGSPALAQCFTQVNDDGWGSSANLYAWSQVTFNNQLYVGTFNPDEGAQILRYDGVNWETVVTAGLNSPNNTGVRNLVIFGDALYAGTRNDVDGAEVWRTTDGVNWEVVVSGGFGTNLNSAVRAMYVYKQRLFVGLQAEGAGLGQLWLSRNGDSWSPVILNGFQGDNKSIHVLEQFGPWLYAGTKNSTTGLQIWRTSNARDWENVVGPLSGTESGFGIPSNNVVFDLHVFDGMLYVGSGNWDFGFSVFRSADGLNFTQVGTLGFGQSDSAYAWRFHTFNNQLWFGAMNKNFWAGKAGSIYRTDDGVTWETLVGAGGTYFNYGFDDWKNWGIRTFEEFNGDLYIGTAQCWFEFCKPWMTGAEIWKYTVEACPP
jgi:hypothetical protein